MNRRITIHEAAAQTGLSEYAIRKGIREGRYPHIRTGLGAGRILIDPNLLDRYLEQEAIDNVIAHRPEAIHYGQLRQVRG